MSTSKAPPHAYNMAHSHSVVQCIHIQMSTHILTGLTGGSSWEEDFHITCCYLAPFNWRCQGLNRKTSCLSYDPFPGTINSPNLSRCERRKQWGLRFPTEKGFQLESKELDSLEHGGNNCAFTSHEDTHLESPPTSHSHNAQMSPLKIRQVLWSLLLLLQVPSHQRVSEKQWVELRFYFHSK